MDIVTVYSECEVLDRSLNNKPELRQAKILEYLQKRKNVKLVKNDELPTLDELSTVHEVRYLECIRDAYPSWRHVDDDDWWANGGVVPNHLPYLRMGDRDEIYRRMPPYKRTAFHASDTMSPINEDTWRNANLSAMNSLKAARMLASGSRFVYALNSSPGHHSTRDHYGGYCFLNNAALAAKSLATETKKQVAVLDLDYHHGNGQQDIFWNDPNVLTISLHVDPLFDYPSFSGFEFETGDTLKSNKNYPLPPDTEDYDYIIALADALKLVKDRQCEFLIVAFGTDTYQGDPDKSNLGGFALTDDVYETLGRMIGGLHLPTLVTQEGGYSMKVVGELTYDFLNGITQQKIQES